MARLLQRGFTLLELIGVIVVVGIGMVGLVSTFSGVVNNVALGDPMQRAAAYAQACAEKVIGSRVDGSVNWFQLSGTSFVTPTFACPAVGSGYTQTLTIGAPALGTTTSLCPNNVYCRNITVKVASSSNANINSTLSILLANY